MDNHSKNTPARREATSAALRVPFSASTEADLVRAMLPGAPDRERAWGEFERREQPVLADFIAYKLGRDRESEVVDVVSEVVIQIELHLERFEHRGEGSFRSWYLRIAQNRCISLHRGRQGEPKPHELVSFDDLEEQLVSPNTVDSWVGSESEPAERAPSEREAAMQQAFASLNPVDQTVIEMKFITPTPDSQIAAIVMKPEAQIRMIRHKALAKLRRAFERVIAGRRRRL